MKLFSTNAHPINVRTIANPCSHVMERDDEDTKRKMKECVKDAAGVSSSAHIYEELRPGSRLNDVRYANNEEANDRKLCNC